MRTLDASQTEAMADASIVPIYLIKLTTYTDREAKTVDTIFYLSKRSLRYNYDGGPEQFFRPWIKDIDDLTSSLTHVVSGRDGTGLSAKAIGFTLHNFEYEGVRVAETLAAHKLEGASVEISELLFLDQPARPIDLTSMAGTEHTVLFNGILSRPAINHAGIVFNCTTEFPKYEWPVVTDNVNASPRDVGFRYPLVVGTGVETLCPALKEGFITTLAEDVLTADTGNKDVDDATGFPATGTFRVRIGTEEIDATFTDADTINFVTRARNGTTAQDHKSGDVVKLLVDEAVYVVHGDVRAGVTKVWVLSPISGQKVQVTTGFTVDTQYYDGVRNVSVVRFSQAQMSALLTLIADQATAMSGTHPVTASVEQQATSGQANIRDNDLQTFFDVPASSATMMTFTDPVGSTVTKRTIHWYIGASGGGWSGTLPTVRVGSTVIHTHNATDLVGWYSAETTDTTNTVVFDNNLSSGNMRIHGVWQTVEYTVEEPNLQVASGDINFDFELFAEVNGAPVPGIFVSGYNFDAGTWATLNCTTSADSGDKQEGVASRELVIDIDALGTNAIQSNDSQGDWSSNNASDTAVPGEGHRSGDTNAIEGDANGSSPASITFHDNLLAIDLTGDATNGVPYVVFDFKIKKGGTTGVISFLIGNGVTNNIQYDFDVADFDEDTWVTIILDRTVTPDVVNGSFNVADWDWFRCLFNNENGSTNCQVYFDNFKTCPSRHVVQNNALGSQDFTTASSLYKVWWKLDSASLAVNLDAVEMYFTDATGTGTTIPANNRQLSWLEANFRPGTWVDLFPSAVADNGTGPGDATDVNTLTIEVDSGYHGILALDPIITLNVDELRVADTALNDYIDAEDATITKAADIARWWIEEKGAGVVNDASMTTANTNLAGFALAGDLRGWGSDWLSVLDHLAFLSRGNFVPEDFSTGTEWKLLNALTTYLWPASSRTLTLFEEEDVSEAGRDTNNDLRSTRTFHYAFKPSISGGADEGYSKVIRISPDENQSGGKVSAATITNALANFSSQEAEAQFLLGVLADATAQDLAGYYYTEGARIASLFVIEDLSWSEGFDLEIGDIVDFVRPWRSGTVKIRIIELTKSFSSERIVELRGVEVA